LRLIFTPATPTKDCTMGSRENHANAGASSTFVQTISSSDMLLPSIAWAVGAALNVLRIAPSCRTGGTKGKWARLR
jgi:hypothetical protein